MHALRRSLVKKFEERLERLEELSEEIKNPELSLEDALFFFEEGIKLAKNLEKDLDKIEGKIQILMNQPATADDKPELDLFSEQDADGR
jgi:exodeoxyribonuclease VII small subunit